METIIQILIYIGFGSMVELFFTGIGKVPKLFDKKNTKEDILDGTQSLWMWPLWTLCVFLYIPIFLLLTEYNVPIYFRYFIWGVLISAMEVAYGLLMDQGLLHLTKGRLSFKIWDYSRRKDSILWGKTNLSLLFLGWPLVGLVLELVTSGLVLNSWTILNSIKYYLSF